MSIVSIVKFLHCNFKNFVLKSKHIKFFQKKKKVKENPAMLSCEKHWPTNVFRLVNCKISIFFYYAKQKKTNKKMFWNIRRHIFYIQKQNEDTHHLHRFTWLTVSSFSRLADNFL